MSKELPKFTFVTHERRKTRAAHFVCYEESVIYAVKILVWILPHQQKSKHLLKWMYCILCIAARYLQASIMENVIQSVFYIQTFLNEPHNKYTIIWSNYIMQFYVKSDQYFSNWIGQIVNNDSSKWWHTLGHSRVNTPHPSHPNQCGQRDVVGRQVYGPNIWMVGMVGDSRDMKGWSQLSFVNETLSFKSTIFDTHTKW